MQQADLWVEVRKKTGKPKRRWNIPKPFADARCSEAILAFLGKPEVGLKRRCDEVDWGGGSVSSREENRLGEEEQLCCFVCSGMQRVPQHTDQWGFSPLLVRTARCNLP